MTRYELDALVDILNEKLYKSYIGLLESNNFYRVSTYSYGSFEYEDFLYCDDSHCITHVMEFNLNDELIKDYWEVVY